MSRITLTDLEALKNGGVKILVLARRAGISVTTIGARMKRRRDAGGGTAGGAPDLDEGETQALAAELRQLRDQINVVLERAGMEGVSRT